MSKQKFLLSRGAWIFFFGWAIWFTLMVFVSRIGSVEIREKLGLVLVFIWLIWGVGNVYYVAVNHLRRG